MFEAIDEFLKEGHGKEAYEALKKICDKDANQKNNVEVLWRQARACHQMASGLESKNPRKKELIVEGQKYGVSAAKLDEKNFSALKWAAVLTGALTDHLGMKEKIQEGYTFKSLLDKALAMEPNEYSLLHMRGRFSYSVANLSWFERKAASAFFATPPTATFDDAIKDFLEVEKLKPNEWIENLLYLAKSYIGKNDKDKARQYLKAAEVIEPADDADREALHEVKALLQKY
jgi:tetratricopeptide (TPR) repeat protein